MNISQPIRILSLAKVKGQKDTGIDANFDYTKNQSTHPLQLKYHNRL